jgi:hypothetical protein
MKSFHSKAEAFDSILIKRENLIFLKFLFNKTFNKI